MCQLTDDATQRLRHLQLGPYTFKKDTAPQPPFVVRNRRYSSTGEDNVCMFIFFLTFIQYLMHFCTYTDIHATLGFLICLL